ncbi:MAG TPA: 3-methyl-2-oxobutanoate hydroxymethyltransferase [Anaerohalosphaeraceae bacterium]|nr:3-methyl-2-oxobutanoate hydroxymethyltransferase [Anaerohalosphaeraceae bacterium]
MGARKNILTLLEMKQTGRKITAVACYDYTTAQWVSRAGVDMILVGDSAAQVIFGYESTLPATMDMMVMLTAAVRRGAPDVCLAADMPFLSYQTCPADAVRNAGRFVREADVQIIKMEVSAAYLDAVKAVSDAGMAVMAHIGIRPQSITKLGRLKAEGTTAELAYELLELSENMVRAGAGALLLEGTAREAAALIARQSPVPVISCGSGPDCDGQILVISDILGLSTGPMPKFSRRFADLGQAVEQAVAAYAQEIREGRFPDDSQCYHIKAGELEKLTQILTQRTKNQ